MNKLTIKKRLYSLVALLLFLLTLIFGIRSARGAESTALLDLEAVLESNGRMYLYNEKTRRLALQTLVECIRGLPQEELEIAGNKFFSFVEWGFHVNNSKYFLWQQQYRELRQTLLPIIQESKLSLRPNDLSGILEKYGDNPEKYDFNVFKEESWIDFTRRTTERAGREVFQTLESLLNGLEKPEQYFKVFYYGYQVYSGREEIGALDRNINSKYLENVGLDVEQISAIYAELHQDYWDGVSQKKDWILKRTASRLFDDFSVSKWCKLERKVCYALARLHSSVSLIDWLVKMVEDIRGNPEAKADERGLLSYFLSQGDVNISLAYQRLKVFFENDQRLFVSLHVTPPSPSPMWILNRDDGSDANTNLNTSIGILHSFFDVSRQQNWTEQLWDVFKHDYYCRYGNRKDHLFRSIVSPIYQEANQDNSVRAQLLQDVRGTSGENYLLDLHRYRIGHYFFSRQKMRDPVATADASKPKTLQFATDIYVGVSPVNQDIYRSVTSNDRGNESRWAKAYIDYVLGEPLRKVCNAFMGRGSVKFSFTDQYKEEQRQLGRILDRIKEVKDGYGINVSNLTILSEISRQIAQELRNEREARQTDKIVDMIKLSLKIAAILEDDTHLRLVLQTLKRDVFRVNEQAQITRLSQTELQRSVDIFGNVHPDLIGALGSLTANRTHYLNLFYRELYLPLRNIYGFFRDVSAVPYTKFLERFNRNELEGIKQTDLQQLSSAGYIDAEAAITALLQEYCRRLSITIWQTPEYFSVNRNVNLKVVYNLLSEDGGWDGSDANYSGALNLFLENIGNRDLRRKSPGEGETSSAYSKWYFFTFLRSILDLHEIYNYPFEGYEASGVFSGDPVKGIEVMLRAKPNGRRPVNGNLRRKLYRAYHNSTPDTTEDFGEIVDLVILLPNVPENNATNPSDLSRYKTCKREVFNRTLNYLQESQTSSQKHWWLQWLCRLEISLLGGESFDYKKIRNKYIPELDPQDRQRLAFEEFKLEMANRSGNWQTDLDTLQKRIQDILAVFYENYGLLKVWGESDCISRVIIELFKNYDPENMLTSLKEEDLRDLWFLIANFGDALDSLSELQPTQRLKASFARTASKVLQLYLFFLPYANGEFTIDLLLGNDNALAAFCMLTGETKRALFANMDKYDYEDSFRHMQSEILSPKESASFLISHNFLPLQLLEKSLEREEILEKLLTGWNVKAVAYKFKLLCKLEESATISLKNLYNESLAGIDLNKDILTTGYCLTDEQYLDYFFRDMRKVFNQGLSFESIQAPQSFDHVIRLLSKMINDHRLQRVINKLKKEHKLDKDYNLREELKRRLELKSYEYFGRVLAENFSSTFNIKMACLMAADKVAEAKKNLENTSFKLYKGFYEGSLFGSNKASFRDEVHSALISRFYPPLGQNETERDYRARMLGEFSALIDGVDEVGGLLTLCRQTQSRNSDFDQRLEEALLQSLRGIFKGEYLERDRIFIGDLIWNQIDSDGQKTIGSLDMENKANDIFQLLNWILARSEEYSAFPKVCNLFEGQGLSKHIPAVE